MTLESQKMQKHCIKCPQQGFSESFSCWHERYLKILPHVNGKRVNFKPGSFYSSLSPLARSPLYTTITIHILHHLFFPFYPNAHAMVLPSFPGGPLSFHFTPTYMWVTWGGPSEEHIITGLQECAWFWGMVGHISRCCPVSNSVAQRAGLLSNEKPRHIFLPTLS